MLLVDSYIFMVDGDWEQKGITMDTFFTSHQCPDFTKNQLGKQAQVARHIKQHGKITAYEIQDTYKTTDARKMAFRLIKKGVIGKTTYEPNMDGKGTHAVYWLKETD